jgi:hypothetical protein
MQSYDICRHIDEYIEDKCIWIATLNDGTKVFQDDDREGAWHPSAWIRLGRYINDHAGSKIIAMRLKFGTHIVELPSNKKAYMYSHGLLQAFNQKYGLNFHVVGWSISDKTMLCRWYKSPELIITKEFRREIGTLNAEQIIGMRVDKT